MQNNKDSSDLSTGDLSTSLSVKTVITKPENAIYHYVEDSHLELLTKMNAPRATMISISCLGYAVGNWQIPFDFFRKSALTLSDKVQFSIFLIAAAISIAAGIFSFIGRKDLRENLKKIRSRKTIPTDNR